MEIFEYHSSIHCDKCKSVQDHHTNMIKKADDNFRILVTCLTCDNMLMSEFSELEIVSEMLYKPIVALVNSL